MDRTYTWEEAHRNCLDYFDGDEMAADAFINKYLLKNKEQELMEGSVEERYRAIAGEFARIEKKYSHTYDEEEIFHSIKPLEGPIVLHGSPVYGIANPYQYVSLSNCFNIGSGPYDSYGGILKSDHDLVQILKRRGGVGMGLNSLRPSGTSVQNSARYSDGAGSFLGRFVHSTAETAQSGRRGAYISFMDCRHPDIENFVEAKGRESLSDVNLSVQWHDDFLEAAENGEKYTLRFPVDSSPEDAEVTKEIDAASLVRKVAAYAWDYGCPGSLFWDTVTGQSISDCYLPTTGVNPCLPGFAPVITPDGIRTFDHINIGSTIWSGDKWTTVLNKWSTGIRPVYKYETTRGTFIGTEDHRIVENGKKVQVNNAEKIDQSTGPYCGSDNLLNLQDVVDGLLVGDGMVHEASNNLVLLCIGQDDQEYLNSEISSFISKYRPGINPCAWEIITGMLPEELPGTYDRWVPDRFFYGDQNKVKGFLRGLFSANGSIINQGYGRITLKQSSQRLIRQVQQMLSSIGIGSYITTNKPANVTFSNGTYTLKQSYDLNITTDIDRFQNQIGFIQEYKNNKLKKASATYCPQDSKRDSITTSDIKSIEYLGEMEVFDITVEDSSHIFWSGGCQVSNCSELPLSDAQSCLLISINLYWFVNNPFTDQASFDYSSFAYFVEMQARLLDDMVDLELEKVDAIIDKIRNYDPEPDEIKHDEIQLWTKIRQKLQQYRKVGGGITGLADMLAALNISYGSTQATQKLKEVFTCFQENMYRTTSVLSKERGPFEGWSWKKEKNNHYIRNLPMELRDYIQKYGRRNVSSTTVAPVGTMSLVHQVSSGGEPVYNLSYYRRRKMSGDEKCDDCIVDDEGLRWKKILVDHPPLKKWKEVTGKDDVEESPYHGCTAHDLNWKDRIKMQSIAQWYIDGAISSTLNLPQEATVEDVQDIYLHAWKSGLKGITIFRSGCKKEGILTGVDTPEESPDDIIESTAPKRPEKLPCDIHVSNIKNKTDGKTNKWIILVSLSDSGKPRELFGGYRHDIEIPRKYKKGVIQKIEKNRYDLLLTNEDGEQWAAIEDIGNTVEPQQGSQTRQISLMLRYGIPLADITKQLLKDSDVDLFTFEKGIARVLKKYIKDGESARRMCPECGEGNLVFIEGCVKCDSCGWSGCS